MRTPLAWHNLVHQKTRTLVALAGVGFALILIFMQLGFLGGIQKAATVLYDHLDFDVLVVSREYVNVNKSGSFPIDRLYQAQQASAAVQAAPLYVGFQLWRNPQTEKHYRRYIQIVAFPLAEQPFTGLPAIDAARDKLRVPDTVLIDRNSRDEFGPKTPGTVAELGGRKVTIVGQFDMGISFGADGVLVTSADTFSGLVGGQSPDIINLGLLKLPEKADPDEAARRLNAVLPHDVWARSRAEVERRERRHWVWQTPAGTIFLLGVGIALVVGVVFVYQVIATDIKDHLRQYATLKAIGYNNLYLAGIVLKQALILALAGYVPAFLVALGLYWLTTQVAGVVIAMTFLRALGVLGLSVAMCSLSGLFALRKVWAADPADLF
jgi:putative ABC transport system permease protein